MGSCTPAVPRTEKALVHAGAFSFSAEFVVDLDAERKRRAGKAKTPPRSSTKLLALLDQAEGWHRELTRKVVNQADLARRHGITRARVTQVLALLRLHPAIVEHIRATAKTTRVSERMLRALTRLAPETQLERVRPLLPSFPRRGRRAS